MAGLDSRGAMDGFAQGYGLVMGALGQRDQMELRRQQIADQAEERQYQRGIDAQRLDMSREQMHYQREQDQRNFDTQQANLQYARDRDQREFDMRNQQFRQNYGLRTAELQSANRRAEAQAQLVERRMQREDKAQQREDDQVQLKSAYARLAMGEQPSEDDLAAFKRNPWADPTHVLSPQMQGDIQLAGQAFMGEADPNSPEGLAAMNRMFGPEVNKGRGGKKAIAGVYPGRTPGTVVFDLAVTRDDGSTHNVPLTKGRGTADDDDHDVLEVPIERLVDRVSGYRLLNGALTSTPELQQRVAQFGRQMGLLPDAGGKPLPSFVQKSEDKDLEALAGSAGINEQLGRIVGQIDSGALELGPLSNRLSEARNYLGSSTDQSRNYASLNSTLETLRNASLRLNAGVQTDGDAKRAWNELITNINDPALVKQRIQEITALNDLAVELKTNMINLRRRNAQAPELDVTSVVPQLGIPKEQSRPQQTPAQQIVRVASDEDYNRLPSGAVFIDPQGNQRRKP
nr:hypothetical protein [Pseudomonas aeruginosa]